MAQSYFYSLSADFPNQQVEPGVLQSEIEADPTIITPLDGIAFNPPDEVVITFVSPIDVNEEQALDAVVAAHLGQSFTEAPLRVNDLPEQTYGADNQWQDACTLTPPTPLRGGDWQLTWNCEIGVVNDVANSGALVRLVVDGAERATDNGTLTQYSHFGGSGLLQVSDGDQPTVVLQFRKIGPNSAKIRRCQIAIVPESF
jgi:hypothetical protein